MIGDTPEIDATVNDFPCTALLDTGSQITTISRSFYNQNLTHVTLENCHDLLRVEGVGGNVLPYDGYVVCEITVPLTDTKSFTQVIPILVVPDTNYNRNTPGIIGTNFLSKIPTNQQPLSSLVPHLQSAVRILQQMTEQLEKSSGVYGHVTACTDTEIPPHSTITTAGRAVITVPICQQVALLQSTDTVPTVPGICNITKGSNMLDFEIANYTDQPITIEKGQDVATLQQVTVVPATTVPSPNEKSDAKKFLESFDFSHLTEAEALKLKDFLCEHRGVFALSSSEMGCTNKVTHTIELLDDTPFREKCRPIPPSAYEELRQHLDELLAAGTITKSKSPFCSNIVMARKKDGSLRLCVDYRKLNSKTKKDAYNIPRIDTLIDSLRGAKYFASLDLFSGYHQVAMKPDDQERTAFSVGPLGFYQFTRMPFGLCNSPSTFQRLMEQVLEGLTMRTCAVYIDDIIVFATSKDDLYARLAEVFERLRQANLTLKPKKCCFFQSSVDFLGHTVSHEGVQCSNRHTEAVTSWPEPSNVAELQTFLGFTGFYRRFIPGYSNIAYPMLKLLKSNDQVKAGHKTKKRKGRNDYVPWEWGQQQREAFELLKNSLVSAPILVYPDFAKPFTLHVDASRRGLGAVLYQEVEGQLRVVAYASRSLVGSERNYTVHKLEFLGLKWAVTSKFHQYLYGNVFTVYTDHNPLVYVTSTARLDANGHRWLQALSGYNFTIRYKPGRTHSDADGLSRRPYPEREEKLCSKTISPEVFKELCALVSGDQEFAGVAESLGLSPSVISNTTQVSYPASVDWSAEQDRDSDTVRVKKLVAKGTRLSERQRKAESPVALRLLSYWDTLSVRDGVLFRTSKINGSMVHRVVIPAQKQQECLCLIHDDMGHLGRDKTLSIAQERFFWVGMTRDIEQKVKTCKRCLCAKAPNLPDKAPLVNIVTSRPLELVCMDFMSLETAVGGYNSILVVTDHFTRYACAYPTRTQEAKTVAKILVEEFFVNYGIPERLHSDQGANFQGRVVTHLCKLLGITKSRTTPYHPEGDGMTERFNRTLISMLKTLDPAQKPRWKDHVSSLVHAYNCTRHESTNYSPFFLMFGRQPRLPVDVFLGLTPDYTSTVEAIRERLEMAYKVASEAAKKAAHKQATHYNRKARGPAIQPGDVVLLRNVGLKGKHKIADKWQQEPFTVLEKPNPDIPVFRIKRGSEVKVVHRNLLLPVTLPFNFPRVDADPSHGDSQIHSTHKLVESEHELVDDDESELSVAVELPTPAELDLQAEPHIQLPQMVCDAQNGLVSPNQDHATTTPTLSKTPEASFPLEEEAIEEYISSPPTNPVCRSPTADDSHHSHVTEELVNSPSSSEELPLPVGEATGLRRSNRNRKPPERYCDVISQNQQAYVTSDWRDRVSILISLINIFPGQQAEIFDTIICLIKG